MLNNREFTVFSVTRIDKSLKKSENKYPRFGHIVI